jgi:hypothetical protein
MTTLPKLDEVLKQQGEEAVGLAARMSKLLEIQLSGLEHEVGRNSQERGV